MPKKDPKKDQKEQAPKGKKKGSLEDLNEWIDEMEFFEDLFDEH